MADYNIEEVFQPELPTGITEECIISCFSENAPKMPVKWNMGRPSKDGEYIVIIRNRTSGKVYVQIDWYIERLGFGFEEYCLDDLIAWTDIPPVS